MSKLITPADLARSGTEDGHQSALFCYANAMANGRDPDTGETLLVPDQARLWGLLYAIPNGGFRTGATAARMRATGVKSGFPDIGFPVARGGWHALFIEMKRPKSETRRKGSTEAVQKDWAKLLREQQNCVYTCYGYLNAVEVISAYLCELIRYAQL